jgi:hypothetical protein
LQRARELHAQWEGQIAARLGENGREQLLELLKKLM